MRDLPEALAAHLAGGVTSLCHCWKLTRRDGVTLGFTDHDRDLSFDGVTYRSGSGLTASESETAGGLQVGGGEVGGVLSDAEITEADIEAGRYDDADVAAFVVNWQDVAQRLLIDVASIGEIRRADRTFVAELRGALHRYDQERGRLYQRGCTATLGDARCGVFLAPLTVDGVIGPDGDTAVFHVPATEAHPQDFFAGGVATFTSGVHAGLKREIRSSGGGVIDLWSPLSQAPAAGDGVLLAPGCDKSFATCTSKFGNTLNFRGFPHIPAPDLVLSYARSGEGGHDGGLTAS